jgi:hypothetical protein
MFLGSKARPVRSTTLPPSVCRLSKAHMGNRRPAGRMRPSTSLDAALIPFSELTHEDEIQ